MTLEELAKMTAEARTLAMVQNEEEEEEEQVDEDDDEVYLIVIKFDSY